MIEWSLDLIERLGYFGIALLMFIETLFPPLPSEAIMPFAGFAASEGRLDLLWVIVSGTAGSMAGALFFFWIGKVIGWERLERFVDEHGAKFGISTSDLDRAQRWFDKYGYFAVLLSRVLPGIRSLISVPAGIRRMKTPPFLVYSLVGVVAWNSVLAVTGFILGSQYRLVADKLGGLTIPVLVIVLGGAIFFLKRRRDRSR